MRICPARMTIIMGIILPSRLRLLKHFHNTIRILSGSRSGERRIDAALPSEEAGDYKVAYQNDGEGGHDWKFVTADAIVQIEKYRQR